VALFSLDIEKMFGDEYWTNRYMINAANLAGAAAVAPSIVTIERNVHHFGVLFTRWRVSDTDPATDQYSIGQVNAQGVVAASGEYLPLFNVCRVDFSTGEGRPSRKFLRLPVVEADQAGGAFNSTFLAFMVANYANPMLAIANYHDVDDQPFVSATVHPSVQMRQLRRGSRRRLQPVLPSV
jgi:hypothetical protein